MNGVVFIHRHNLPDFEMILTLMVLNFVIIYGLIALICLQQKDDKRVFSDFDRRLFDQYKEIDALSAEQSNLILAAQRQHLQQVPINVAS
jgi:hypothetical protein